MLIGGSAEGQVASQGCFTVSFRCLSLWAMTTSVAFLAPTLLAGSPLESSLRPIPRPVEIAADQIQVLTEAGDSSAPVSDLIGVGTQPEPSTAFAKDDSLVDVAFFVVAQPPAESNVTAPDDTPLPVPAQNSVQPNATEFGTTSKYVLPFIEERDAQLAALMASDAQNEAALRLDYVQFLIAHMMLAEAQSMLADLPLDGPALDTISRDRALGYAAILSRLAGQPPATPVPPIWRNDPLWSLVLAAPQDAWEPGGADLRAALAALSRQSRSVATAVLPILFDHALLRGDVGVAAEILVAAPAGTDLDGSDALEFMRGRLALAQGGEEMAFDIFARVSEGRGEVAANARLALADMALSRDDPTLLPQVRDLLRAGLSDWRGDEVALRLRVQLARVAEEITDDATAIEVMAMIRREHPDTSEATLADQRLGVLLDRVDGQFSSGEMPLDEAVAIVRRLDPLMAGRGDWIAVRVRLAERFQDAGLIKAALAEYADIAALPAATLHEADAQVLDAAAHRQAGLLLANGDPTGALAALDRRLIPGSANLLIPAAGLRVAANGTGDFPAPFLAALDVGEPSDITDPVVQIGLAKTAQDIGNTANALAAYDQSIEIASLPERVDAARLAGEAKDKDRAGRYVAYLPGERGQRQGALVEKLVTEAPIAGPLSVGTAETIIAGAQEAGAAITALLGPGDL